MLSRRGRLIAMRERGVTVERRERYEMVAVWGVG